MAADGEAARGRWQLSERLFSASLAGDSGSWLLLHIEGVMVVRFPSFVGGDSGQRWLATLSRARARVRQSGEREVDEEEGRGEEPSATHA
jgi:hypothetical protein